MLGGQGRSSAEADAVLHIRLRLQREDHQRDAVRPRACRDHQVYLFKINNNSVTDRDLSGSLLFPQILAFFTATGTVPTVHTLKNILTNLIE